MNAMFDRNIGIEIEIKYLVIGMRFSKSNLCLVVDMNLNLNNVCVWDQMRTVA